MTQSAPQTFYLRLKALTPIHVGTGHVYEPTSYVMDDGFLYEFDPFLLYKHLPANLKSEFRQITAIQSDRGYELFEKIHGFFYRQRSYAKEVAHTKVQVSNHLERYYHKSIGQPVQNEGGRGNRQSVFNRFEIMKTSRHPHNTLTYLPGSSIKGSIATAYQEAIFKQSGEKAVEKLFDVRGDKLFRNLLVSDTTYQKSTSQIGYAINLERFESDDDAQISTMIEINAKGSEYLLKFSIKDLYNDKGEEIREKITKEKIIEACNSHYKPIFEDKEKSIALKQDQFLLSVGRHSGARAVTIDGLRKILVKLAQIQNKKDEGNDIDARIQRLHKKSHFENSKILELLADPALLDNKGKAQWNTGKSFLESPSRLENKVRDRERFTINAILKEETTIWRFGEDKDSSDDLDSFGWVICEFIDEKDYETLAVDFQQYAQQKKQEKEEREGAVAQALLKAKEQEEEQKRQKELQRQREEEEAKARQEAEAQKLAAMSPEEKHLHDYQQHDPNAKLGTLAKKILQDDATLEEAGTDAKKMASLLKRLMQQSGEWKEKPTAKKPEKDKPYQSTLLVMKYL